MPIQNGASVLKSTGGFAQRDVSPCILIPQDSSGMRGLRLPRQVPRGAGKGRSRDRGERHREGRDEDADQARVDEEGGGLGGHLEEQDREHWCTGECKTLTCCMNE